MRLLLIIPTKYLGNMVIAMQTIAAVLAHSDTDDVTILVDETFTDLLRIAFARSTFLVYPRLALGEGNGLVRGMHYVKFIRRLRQQRYDCALDLDGTVVSGRLASMCRAARKVGPNFAKRTGPYTELVPVDRDSQHCFEDFVLMAAAIDLTVVERTYLKLPQIDPLTFASQLDDFPIAVPAGARVACIHPCATKDYKQWDINKFATLSDWLIEQGWTVIVIGAGKAEQSRISEMLTRMQHDPINAHGLLNLVQLVFLLQRTQLFIGNDSGPMHLASVCGPTVLALFGPTELVRWQPRSPTAQVLKGELPCSPQCRPEACLNDYQCLRSLAVSQVQQKIAVLSGP